MKQAAFLTKRKLLPCCMTGALSHFFSDGTNRRYTIPCAIIAFATFMKPAILAPFT